MGTSGGVPLGGVLVERNIRRSSRPLATASPRRLQAKSDNQRKRGSATRGEWEDADENRSKSSSVGGVGTKKAACALAVGCMPASISMESPRREMVTVWRRGSREGGGPGSTSAVTPHCLPRTSVRHLVRQNEQEPEAGRLVAVTGELVALSLLGLLFQRDVSASTSSCSMLACAGPIGLARAGHAPSRALCTVPAPIRYLVSWPIGARTAKSALRAPLDDGAELQRVTVPAYSKTSLASESRSRELSFISVCKQTNRCRGHLHLLGFATTQHCHGSTSGGSPGGHRRH